jgi:ankyrin repeat protein
MALLHTIYYSRDRYSIIELLLIKSAKVDSKDNVSCTLLLYSIEFTCNSVAKLLLKSSTKVNSIDNIG